MEKRILMVYPEYPTSYWSMKYALPFVRKKTNMVPLGLLTVAALLPEHFDVSLVDLNCETLNEEDIASADMVFISAMLVQKPSFDEVVKLCRELGTPVVAGGPYPTTTYAEIEGVDHFVLNEAEVTLPRFLRDLEVGQARKIYRDTEKVEITRTPPPRFDLINFDNYFNMALQFSRGCPFNCEFCDVIELFGRKTRTKEPEQFIREINLLYNEGYRGSVFIVDDNFIGNRARTLDMLKLMSVWQKEHDRPLDFYTEASINIARDDELLELMIDAGFHMVFIGIETPDADSLRLTNKIHNLRSDLLADVKKIQSYGLEVTSGFIVGFDSDKEDIFPRMIDFIQEAAIPLAMVGILCALPDTQLYRRLKKEGRLKADYRNDGNNTNNLEMGFMPMLPERTIIDGYKRIISEIYNPKRYFQRCLEFLKRLPRKKPKPLQNVNPQGFAAFFRSMFRQTFSRYGFHYHFFLFRVFFFRLRHYPLAVRQAIQGHHFFKITRNIIRSDNLSRKIQGLIRTVRNIRPLKAVQSGLSSFRMKKKISSLLLLKRRWARRLKFLNEDVKYHVKEQINELLSVINSRLAGFNKVN